MKGIRVISVLFFSLFACKVVAWDGTVSGIIAEVDAVASAGGAPGNQDVRIFITGSPLMCNGGSQYVYFNVDDSNYKALLALVLLAKATGQSVGIYSNNVGGFCHLGYLLVNS